MYRCTFVYNIICHNVQIVSRIAYLPTIGGNVVSDDTCTTNTNLHAWTIMLLTVFLNTLYTHG